LVGAPTEEAEAEVRLGRRLLVSLWRLPLIFQAIKGSNSNKSEVLRVSPDRSPCSSYRIGRPLAADYPEDLFESELDGVGRVAHVMDDHVQEYLVVHQLLLELPHLRLQGLDLPYSTKLFIINPLIRLFSLLFRRI